MSNRVADGLLGTRGDHPQEPRAAITERESQVLRLVAVGHSNKEIADRLKVSIKTVELHKANAMRKLGLTGRVDVIRYGVLQGWLYDTEPAQSCDARLCLPDRLGKPRTAWHVPQLHLTTAALYADGCERAPELPVDDESRGHQEW